MNSQEPENSHDKNSNAIEELIYNLSNFLSFNPGDLLKLFGISYGLLLMLGGFIFVIYFFSINYMPNLSWESSVSLLFTAAIVSMIIIIMVAIVFVSPGLLWLSTVLNNKYPKSLLSEGDRRPKGFIRLNTSAMLLLFSVSYLTSISFNEFVINAYNLMYLSIAILMLCIALYIPYNVIKNSRIALTLAKNKGILYPDKNHRKYSSENNSKINHDVDFRKTSKKSHFKYLVKILILKINPLRLILTSIYPSFILIIMPVVYIVIVGKEKIQFFYNKSEYQLISIFIFFYFVAIVSNKIITFVCFDKKNIVKYTEAFIIGFSVFFFISIFFSSFAELPKIVMNRFGWGNIQRASIVVNKEGCLILEAMDMEVEGNCSNASNVYKANDIDILLNLGEDFIVRRHFYIEDKKSKKSFSPHMIILPKKLVLSWARPQYRE
ncbi:hypothetical protein [Acaryochloris marina]|uniref:hypothetical protein n=1 Tax=Acaryochloris marina TaxID=155978 RepID=UPI001BB090DE|nr:hypothetical protein [Acaryochloris marina]QUY42484.1 hypothetical protein I1H34_25465 [Acaryochloris marina S15]